jgi:hypothetical protein
MQLLAGRSAVTLLMLISDCSYLLCNCATSPSQRRSEVVCGKQFPSAFHCASSTAVHPFCISLLCRTRAHLTARVVKYDAFFCREEATNIDIFSQCVNLPKEPLYLYLCVKFSNYSL